MAYTKIHAIKASVSAAVNYIINPNKTDEKRFFIIAIVKLSVDNNYYIVI